MSYGRPDVNLSFNWLTLQRMIHLLSKCILLNLCVSIQIVVRILLNDFTRGGVYLLPFSF